MTSLIDIVERPFESERSRYLPRLLENPNYFGNLNDSPFEPVKEIVANTSYEELKCIGYNPQLRRLEGVVWIKRDSGYEGGLCSKGSLEYLSFYLSYNNGATWLLQGTTSFQAFDVGGHHPLEYAVDLAIQPERPLCFRASLPLARVVLSWATPPVGPTTQPVWGNIIEARIQVAPIFRKIPFSDFLKAAEVTVLPEYSALIAETSTIDLAAAQPLTAAELQKEYAGKDVPAHRYLHGTIQKALQYPAGLAGASGVLSKLGVDIAGILKAFEKPEGSTAYEELGCIGLDEGGTPAALVGTVQIKRPTGYLGGLCTAGSKEYVAFWIDWGSGWEWVGTPSVSVYDIKAIPKEGLQYAVYWPVDLSPHRKPCGEGPVTAKMRAILSWDTPPPSGNPNFVPVWGSRLDTSILIGPGATVEIGDYTPTLQGICSVAVQEIDPATGWAPGQSPFGAAISIYGIIPGSPSLSQILAGKGPKYQVTVQQYDLTTSSVTGSPQVLTDPFNVTVDQVMGGGAETSFPLTQSNVGGYYSYQISAPTATDWQSIFPDNLLAVWNSTATGTWLISITAIDPVTHVNFPGNSVVIDLDQRAPVTDLEITGYIPGGVGPVQTAVNCQTFTVGDIICGTYSVSDEHLGSFSLSEEPFPALGSFTIEADSDWQHGVAGSGMSYPDPALPLSGTLTGNWTFNTGGPNPCIPCGYTIQLSSGDRTIVDCVTNWENNLLFRGFCLKAAGGGD